MGVGAGLYMYDVVVKKFTFAISSLDEFLITTVNTTHRTNTSMYSLKFCVRFLLPELHQWKLAVQTTAVMLRTPPVGGRSPAGGAHRPRPAGRSHYVVISRDGRKLVTRVRVMLP